MASKTQAICKGKSEECWMELGIKSLLLKTYKEIF